MEVIDLYDPTSICDPLSNYPNKDYGMAVTLIDGYIKSCGSQYDRDDCYDYDFATNQWTTSESMLTPRANPKASLIDGVWLVSGDNEEIESGNAPFSTEIWSNGQFAEGPTLPAAMYNHCQLTVNSTHVFFGNKEGSYPSFLLNWENQEWTELPTRTNGGYFPSCGLINNPENGLEAVVVEDGHSDILNFNTLQWRAGPSLEYSFDRSGSAQLTDTFVVVGGSNYAGTDTLNTIYQFDHINYDWILLSKKMQIKRQGYFGVLAVTDDLVSCS